MRYRDIPPITKADADRAVAAVRRATRKGSAWSRPASAAPVAEGPKCPTCGGAGLVPAGFYDPTLGLPSANERVACRRCRR